MKTIEEYYQEWECEQFYCGDEKDQALGFAEDWEKYKKDFEEQTKQPCQYESDDTTAMNCKYCGGPKWTHDHFKSSTTQ